MKILLIGDTHGNFPFISEVPLFWSRADQWDHAVVLGDFGYWPHKERGRLFLSNLSKHMQRIGKELHFVDGNHENHDDLEALEQTVPRDALGAIEVAPLIKWLPRGTYWNWGGLDFLAVGGAHSIDKRFRTIGESWWAQETLTDAQVSAIVQDTRPVDVMLAHDCTSHFPGLMEFEEDFEGKINRQLLGNIIAARQPELMFHGHMHKFKHYRHNNTQVFGLAADVNFTWTYGILDTEAFTFKMPGHLFNLHK